MTFNDLFDEYNNVLRVGKESELLSLFYKVRTQLESGELRVANKIDGRWVINSWVKEVILLGFKLGKLKEYSCAPLNFVDKETFPTRSFELQEKIRIVPGGSSVRAGAYLAKGSVVMPPSYINTGAFIDTGCMIDSNALIGSCAQIGKNVHISAATQIGGVLEPIGALPVIVEDDVFVGGNCGVYEGTIIKEGAVIASGVILNGSTPLYDNTTGKFITGEESGSLVVPAGAVVVSGCRPITRGAGATEGISLYCPVIVKYKDDKTKGATALEELLR